MDKKSKKNHSTNNKQPIFRGDKSLSRDLVVLRRSRTLRDPSERRRSSIAPIGEKSSVQRNGVTCYGDDDVAVSCNDNDRRKRPAVGNRGKGRNRDTHHSSSGYEKKNGNYNAPVASNSFAQEEERVSFTLKYTPRTFEDLIGQSLAARALSNAVSRGKIGPIYVFHGPRGTGKTSCARIFARALNCRSRAGPKPCGSCVARDGVREIIIGSDNLELENAARKSRYYRVLIFDECDALARTEKWGPLVRAVYRAPRDVVFVCSGLELLPRAITSRSHKFFFPKIQNGDIMRVLRSVATREDVEIDEDALELVSSVSNGSLRVAETILDRLTLLGRRISTRRARSGREVGGCARRGAVR